MRPLMWQILRILVLLLGGALAIIFVSSLGGCSSVPKVPEKVTVVVEKYKRLPDWATKLLVKPMPWDGTVDAYLKSEDQRGNVIDLANCHRWLLKKLDAGETVSPEDCKL
jgi:hypothetical protein